MTDFDAEPDNVGRRLADHAGSAVSSNDALSRASVAYRFGGSVAGFGLDLLGAVMPDRLRWSGIT